LCYKLLVKINSEYSVYCNKEFAWTRVSLAIRGRWGGGKFPKNVKLRIPKPAF
jgi:hypothetical protein